MRTLNQAEQVRKQFLKMRRGVTGERVEEHEADGKEDHVDEDNDNDSDASPLQPKDFANTSIDNSCRAGSDAGCVGRKSGAHSLRLIVAKSVLKIYFQTVCQTGFIVSSW